MVSRAALIAAVLVGLLVVAQNTDVVTLRFLFWRWSMSQVLLLPLVFLLGGAAGAAAAAVWRRRR